MIEAQRVGSDTPLVQIVRMVAKASRSRAPIQNLVDVVAACCVQAVVGIAILTFIVWGLWGLPPALAYAPINAVAMLIIACPCALGLATPMSDAALFVSEDGDLSLRAELEHDLLLTQRLVLQPRVEANAAAQRVKSWGVGRSINDVQLGLRLRYEIRRQFAPYVGVEWTRKLGDTADIVRDEGEDESVPALVGGVRLWF